MSIATGLSNQRNSHAAQIAAVQVVPCPWLRASVAVFATLLLLNVTLVFGRHTGHWDASDYFLPFYALVADAARHGELLTWNPLINGGSPVGSDPQVGAYSPLTVACGLLTGGTEAGFRIWWLAVWALGGLGMLRLARHFAALPWFGYLAAVGYLFCGIYTGHASHTSYLMVASLLPWIIERCDECAVRRSWKAAVEAGALLGLAALAGYPGMIMAVGMYGGLWLTVRPWLSRSESNSDADRGESFARRLRFCVISAALFGFAAAVVASPSYFDFLHNLQGYGTRAEPLSRAEVVGYSPFQPAMLASFASPLAPLVSWQADRLLWRTDVSLTTMYVCPILIVAALTALLGRREQALGWFVGLLGVFFLACAMSEALPLRGWLYDLVPPTRFFRHAALFRCLTLFSLVVLALLGSREFLTEGRRRSTFVAGLWCLLSFSTYGVVLWLCHESQINLVTRIIGLVHLGLVGGLLWLACRRASRPSTPRMLIAIGLLDAVCVVVLSKPVLFGPQIAGPSQVPETPGVAAVVGWQRDARVRTEGWPNNWNVFTGQATLFNYSSLWNQRHLAIEGTKLEAAATGSDRIWFAPQAADCTNSAEDFDALLRRCETLPTPCLAVMRGTDSPSNEFQPQAANRLVPLSDAPPAERIAVSLLEYLPRKLRFAVDCPADGWLLVTDRWARGWQATLDGESQELWVGNYVFRALPVTRGMHEVGFEYRPAGVTWLVMLSWSTLAGIVIVPRIFNRFRSVG